MAAPPYWVASVPIGDRRGCGWAALNALYSGGVAVLNGCMSYAWCVHTSHPRKGKKGDVCGMWIPHAPPCLLPLNPATTIPGCCCSLLPGGHAAAAASVLSEARRPATACGVLQALRTRSHLVAHSHEVRALYTSCMQIAYASLNSPQHACTHAQARTHAQAPHNNSHPHLTW